MSSSEPSASPGQVFLAHGLIETVVHDAAVIPTDGRFSVRDYWIPLLGKPRARTRPEQWPQPFARSAVHNDVWLINVGDIAQQGISTLTRRVGELLSSIAESHLKINPHHTKLRVAMPVLAIAGGGMAARQGEVVRALMESLETAARDLDIDVVLVTPDRSVFSAVQHIRRELNAWHLPPDDFRQAKHLGHLAGQGHLALFLGAGVSVSAGLPTWAELLADLKTAANVPDGAFDRLPALDQAQLLEKRLSPNLGKKVADITQRAQRPSLAHALLAGLGCAEVVTTNYDHLYEIAARATGQPVTSILPWAPTSPGHPWVLKMHGDVERPESIVLTRRQFVRFDAATRPAGSLLQSLLLTRHLLVVGASLNDDNVSRLAHEADEFRRSNGVEGSFGTFLDVDGVPAREELWSSQLEWIELHGDSMEKRVRNLEVTLDAVAAYATTDASWLLDPRFEGLLTPAEREVATDARMLQKRAAELGPAFKPLIKALLRLGASPPP